MALTLELINTFSFSGDKLSTSPHAEPAIFKLRDFPGGGPPPGSLGREWIFSGKSVAVSGGGNGGEQLMRRKRRALHARKEEEKGLFAFSASR